MYNLRTFNVSAKKNGNESHKQKKSTDTNHRAILIQQMAKKFHRYVRRLIGNLFQDLLTVTLRLIRNIDGRPFITPKFCNLITQTFQIIHDPEQGKI